MSAVLPGTPAAKAGIAAGDVITAIDGTAIQGSDGLGKLLQGHHGGDKVSVTWTDSNGKSHTSSVTLIAGPAN